MKFSVVLIYIGVLFIPASSMKLNCDFSYIENCVKNCYQCNVLKLFATRQNQTVTEIFGDHLEYETIGDATTLRVVDQTLNFIPYGLGHHFPYLLVLKIWSSNLNQLEQKDIRDFKYLTDLSVSGNNLEVLSSNLFEHNFRLKHIDFTRNRLQHVGLSLLKPLSKLVFADFYHNDCISDGAKFSFEVLTENLRKNCEPTNEMMFEEIDALNREVEILRDDARSYVREIEKREKKLRVCQDGKQASARLDTLFPGELVWDEVWRE